MCVVWETLDTGILAWYSFNLKVSILFLSQNKGKLCASSIYISASLLLRPTRSVKYQRFLPSMYVFLIKALKSYSDWLSWWTQQTSYIKISPGACSKIYSPSPSSTFYLQPLVQGPRTLHFNKGPCWFSETLTFENYLWLNIVVQPEHEFKTVHRPRLSPAVPYDAAFTEGLASSSAFVIWTLGCLPTNPPDTLPSPQHLLSCA